MIGLLAALALAVTAEHALASPAAEETVSFSQPFIGSPVWNRKPNQADFARFSPSGYKPVSPRFGGVMLDCGVRADGTLYGCTADSRVSDMRVAEASVAVAAAYRMDPKTRDGTPTAGGRIRLSITWSTPRGDDIPPARPGEFAPLLSINSPLWAKRPSQDEILAAMPVTTRLAGGKGEAVVRCQVDDTGELRRCAVESETPGLGLGHAARSLARTLALPEPETIWRRGPVRVLIRFDAAAPATLASAGGNPVLAPLVWTDAPTAEVMKALHPGAIPGDLVQAPFICAVGYGGLLGDCLIERDIMAAEEATLKALPRLTTQTPDTPQGATQGLLVRGSVTWLNGRPLIRSTASPPPLPIPPARPRASPFARAPSQEDFGRLYPPAALAAGRYGWATLKCAVAADGRLSACKVENDYPRDQGFAEATLALAPLYQLRPPAPGDPKIVSLPIEWRLPGGYGRSGLSQGSPWEAPPPDLPSVHGRVEAPQPPILGPPPPLRLPPVAARREAPPRAAVGPHHEACVGAQADGRGTRGGLSRARDAAGEVRSRDDRLQGYGGGPSGELRDLFRGPRGPRLWRGVVAHGVAVQDEAGPGGWNAGRGRDGAYPVRLEPARRT